MKVKKDYYYYKENRICWYCKTAKVEKGIACNSCKEIKRKEQLERVHYHRDKGYCYRCGNKLTKYDKGAICGACKYDDRVNAQLKRDILNEKGLCIKCKKKKENKNKSLCDKCSSINNQKMRERYYQLKGKRGVKNE